MKEKLPIIAGGLLGLAFLLFGINFFVPFLPKPPGLPEGSLGITFMSALVPSGYLAFVKVLEILGGLLTAIPKTRNIGLLLLGPILVNIVCFHIFFKSGRLLDPVLIILCLLAVFSLFAGRKKFAGLLN